MGVVVEKLAGTDRRSIGAADEVAEEIAADQALFDEVFEALWFDDPVIRMRAADALEKASRRCPERLVPHKGALLGELAEIEQHEVRWHVAQMLPRLPLNPQESGPRRSSRGSFATKAPSCASTPWRPLLCFPTATTTWRRRRFAFSARRQSAAHRRRRRGRASF